VHADGTESKQFNIRDGAGMVWAQRAGLTIGLLSARMADATAVRAAQLGIDIVVQGSANKLAGYEQILREQALTTRRSATWGTNCTTAGAAARGFSAAPARCRPGSARRGCSGSARAAAGAARRRECIEHVLRAQGHWRTAVGDYLGS
jgi:3-deoxy-D-manno-octulosonate 8-phosphate phosphatase (KDO 8-P phosphatase)